MAGQKKIGVVGATFLVAGNMMGSGVFLLPSSLAKIGTASIWGWLITTAGALLLAFVFAKLGKLAPKAGGPYAYARDWFGPYMGFQTNTIYWFANWIGNVAIPIAAVGYFAQIPHYVSGPYPGASVELLSALGRHLGVILPSGDLVEEVTLRPSRGTHLVLRGSTLPGLTAAVFAPAARGACPRALTTVTSTHPARSRRNRCTCSDQCMTHAPQPAFARAASAAQNTASGVAGPARWTLVPSGPNAAAA